MSGIAAVRRALDEPTIAASRASVEAQTLRPVETIEIHGIRPFHRAWNVAAGRVRAPYFLQVDADMILDPVCLERLRAGVSPHLAIRVGALPGPPMGTDAGGKLLR